MAHRRTGLVVALALAGGAALAATQGPPVYTYTGTAPSGSCSGTRVLIDALGSGTYYCNGGTWAAITSGGGGAPTTVPYWTGASDGTLSAEHNLGALATGLVLNTAGTPSAYAGASCTAPNLVQSLSASGAAGCYQLKLDELANPGASTTFTMANKTLVFSYQAPVGGDGAFEIEATGGFSGDLVHIHQHTGNPAAGTDLVHAEWADTDVTGLRLTGPSAAAQAATITGKVDVTGQVTATSFSGPLTGAVTGNASTASALASDPTACGAGGYVTDISAAGVLTCSTPPGTYTLPAASTTLGGVKMAAACGAGNHVSSIGAGGELGCTADAGGSGAPTTAQYWVGAADAGLSAEKDLSGFTGLVLNTAGTPSSKAANTCTNQFARSDNASGVWTCASIAAADLPAASTTLGAVKHAANCAAGNHVNGIGAGGELSCSADSGGTPSFSGLTAGGAMYANSTTTIASTSTGTSGRSTLTSGGTGAPTWVQGVRGVTMTQDRTINATTAASTTDLVWPINANEGQTFTCSLTSTSTATSKIRYAVAGPASMTYVNCRVILGTTSLTTLVANTIQAQWASTCTGCTNSVTASVLTSKITDTLQCSVTNGANAGNITIYFADSTAGQVNTLHKGSGCLVTGGG